jgi:hypothetical protein
MGLESDDPSFEIEFLEEEDRHANIAATVQDRRAAITIGRKQVKSQPQMSHGTRKEAH